MKNQKFIVSMLLSVALMTCFGNLNLAQTPYKTVPTNENLVMATLYFQRAAEVKALYLQAYNIARLRLDQELAIENTDATKLAIVLDIDETVLDNSPYQGKAIFENLNFPTCWDSWVNKAVAEPLPGAVEFLNYAAFREVQIYYITNRDSIQRDVTVSNLLKKGFPKLNNDHLLLRTDISSKEERRLKVLRNCKIIMLIGDNLSDFDKVFDNQTMAGRTAAVDSLKNEFGKRFIILPNPMYGDWVKALYNNSKSLSTTEKQDLNYKLIKGF